MVRLLTKEDNLAAAEKPAEPFIMARIVDLAAFLEMLSEGNAQELKAVSGFRFYFDDPLIPENRGLWEIRAGSAVRCSDKAEVPAFTPEQLAPLLFGYRAPGQETAGERAEEPRTGERELLRILRPLRGICFDEET